MRFWSGLAIAICLAAITAGGVVIAQDSEPPADPGSAANLWIDDDGGTCTRSSTPDEYDDAAACASFAAAEDADSVGDLVIARCDDETSCTVQSGGDTLDSSNAGFITYREETGYTVTVGGWARATAGDTFSIDGDKIIVEGFDVPHLETGSTASDVVARGISGGSFDIDGDNIVLTGPDSEWSYLPCSPTNTDVIAQGPYLVGNGDFVVRDLWFHDNDPTGCETGGNTLHTDCLQWKNTTSTLVERTEFGPACGVGDVIIIGDGSAGNLDNIIIWNSIFHWNQDDATDINYDREDLCGGTQSFRFNTIAPERGTYGNISTGCTTNNVANILHYANTGSSNCGGGDIGDWTMFMSGAVDSDCGANSFVASPSRDPGGGCSNPNCGPRQADLDAQLVDQDIADDPGHDSHLIASSDAIDAFGGTASLCPHGDFDGHLRDATCDIGADEYDSAGNGDAPDWYVDDAGSDSNMCTFVLPCLTIDRAYDMAAAGDVIGLLSGTYANQTVTSDFSKNSDTDIVVQPAPGATAVIESRLTIDGANNLTVRDIATRRWVIEDSSDITMQDIDTNVLTITSGTDILVDGGDVGPCEALTDDNVPPIDSDDCDGAEDSQVGGGFDTPSGCAGNTAPAGNGTTCTQDIVRVTFDGVVFHDQTNVDNPGAHSDCLQFYEGEDVVIRNSIFRNDCGESNDLYIRGDAGPVDGFLIENNWFSGEGSDYSIRLSGISCPQDDASSCTPPCRDVTIRNNTALHRIAADCAVLGTGLIRGNYNLQMSGFHCSNVDWGTSKGWTYELNVDTAVAGGEEDCTALTGTPDFVNSTPGVGFDLHLDGTSEGENDLPAPHADTDIDGTGRASTADIGADER